MNSKHFPVHVVNVDETWTYGRGTQSETVVRKAAVRVRAGASGKGVNRPGTFQGATNFRGSARPV